MPSLKNGYEIINQFVSQFEINTINAELNTVGNPARVGGVRSAQHKFPSIHTIAHSEHVLKQAKQYLASTPSLVRAILFNKTQQNNWLVTWHQDRTVAVSEKFERLHWGPWSVKGGLVHVQPPVQILNQMVTIRIHLDDSTPENGCLKVLPKSHLLGILSKEAIQQYVKSNKPVVCDVMKGAALIMRPHLLHASSKASKPSQRRVLHLEYSDYALPAGIAWA